MLEEEGEQKNEMEKMEQREERREGGDTYAARVSCVLVRSAGVDPKIDRLNVYL